VSVELIERAAAALGSELLREVAFLGAAAMPLWVTEPGAPPWRPTRDVDVVVEVASRIDYYALGDRLKEQGFEEDSEAREICAWRHTPTALRLDVMPTEAEIIGFTNRWYGKALRIAVDYELPSETTVRAVPPPYLLATKLEAFKGRGRTPDGEPDYMGSRDFEDIVALIDSRPELVDEVLGAELPLRQYVAAEFDRMRADFQFESAVLGQLQRGFGGQGRREIVLARIERMRSEG
jgi:Nucleotidyl transferase AbiEii toxin, Type IV TA system